MSAANFVPLVLRPLAREIRYRIRAGNRANPNESDVVSVQNQWSRIIDASADYLNRVVSVGSKAMFCTGYGLGSHYLTVEPILMSVLVANGWSVESLYCGASIPACEFNAVGNNQPDAGPLKAGVTRDTVLRLCNTCTRNARLMLNTLPVTSYTYRDYLQPEDYVKAARLAADVEFSMFRDFVYRDVAVGEEAWASILRVTFKGTVPDTRENRLLAKRFVTSGILLTMAYERAILDRNPDRLLMIHGVYLTHGLAAKVGRKMDVPVVVIGGGGIRKDTVIMCHRETYHHQLVEEPNSEWEDDELTETQIETVLDYAAKKRHSGSGVDYLSYHPNPIEDAAAIRGQLQIPEDVQVITLYTNVIWDAQVVYRSNVFQDIYDWVFESIETVANLNRVILVIRIHPAEVKGVAPTRQPMLKEIERRYPNLPRNVRVVPPESDISSYTLASLSDCAVVYGTKMALELALMRTPLLICGETFSRNKGYGVDITSRRMYQAYLRDVSTVPPIDDERYSRALKYAYYLYFRRMIDMPFTTGIDGKRINIADLSELKIGVSAQIDTIYRGIAELAPFKMPIP